MTEQSKVNKLICKVVYTADKIFSRNQRLLYLCLGLFYYIAVIAFLLLEHVGFFLKPLGVQSTIIIAVMFCIGSITIFLSNPHVREYVSNNMTPWVLFFALCALFAMICFLNIIFGIIIGSLISLILIPGEFYLIEYFRWWISNNCPKFSGGNK
jgi:hypothetical protein